MNNAVEEVRLSLPHIELAAHLFGPEDGLPVIALHGWLDNANSFARLAPKLNGLRIIALDMAGHGHSGHRPSGAGYALWDYAHDVLQVAEQLGWQTPDHCVVPVASEKRLMNCADDMLKRVPSLGFEFVSRSVMSGGLIWNPENYLNMSRRCPLHSGSFSRTM